MSPAIESFGFRLEGCLCRRKKTSGTNQTKIAPSPEESIVKQPCGGNDVTDHEDSRQEMTWKKLSGLLDRFFFLTFMFTIALATGAFIMIISLKLLSYWKLWYMYICVRASMCIYLKLQENRKIDTLILRSLAKLYYIYTLKFAIWLPGHLFFLRKFYLFRYMTVLVSLSWKFHHKPR